MVLVEEGRPRARRQRHADQEDKGMVPSKNCARKQSVEVKNLEVREGRKKRKNN